MSKQAKEFSRMLRQRFKRQRLLETGFTMLEAVVVVGVLLALAAGGFLAYGPITDNAKTAAVRTAASSVYTAILVAQSDGDPTTSTTDVVDDYNASNTKLKAEIREAGTEAAVAAMTTADYSPKSDNDFCLRVTNLEKPTVFAEMGNCKVETTPVAPSPSPTPTSTETATPSPEPTPSPTATASRANYASSWGYNTSGQLGNNSTTNSSVPVDVTTTGVLAGKKITSISGRNSHTCALADGAPYCWARNVEGQLGDGTITSSLTPIAVNITGVLSGKTITSISVGGQHTCVVADGKPYCWGSNDNGQLGNNNTTNSSVPVAVTTTGALAGKTITSIEAGYYHACVIADGKPYCWGDNIYGQLGNNTTTDSLVPVAVTTAGVLAGKTITSLASGANHTCVIADSKSYCWGANYHGQLGNNTYTASSIPVAVTATGVLAGKTTTVISPGTDHTCVIADGKSYCWGYNNNGQLGNGNTTPSSVPVAVTTTGALAGKTITSITTGYQYNCVLADGKPYCWGWSQYGQLGNGSTTNSTIPVAVTTTGVLSDKTITSISGKGHSIFATYD